MINNNSSSSKLYTHAVFNISRHCCADTYGICHRCDRCGYMTRRDEYEDLKESVQRLCDDSKESAKKTDTLQKDIYDFELACKKISRELEKYKVNDKNMEKLFFKVKILSKFAKKFAKIFSKFIKEIEEVERLAKLVKNQID